jgi:UDP-glucose 4-epimerase
MAILVTGDASYIGSHTVVQLLERGDEVVVIDNFSNSHPEVLQRIKTITNKQAYFMEGDVNDGQLLKRVFNDFDINSVIHFAGYKAMRIAVLRYFNPVGRHPNALIGEDPNGIPNNLMPFVAKVAVGQLPQVGVFGDDYDTKDGTGARDYIHVVDLAAGHLAALNKLSTQAGWQAYNIGMGKGYSVLEVIKSFAKIAKKGIDYQILPRRAGDIATYLANIQYTTENLDWRAKANLDEMINYH